MMWPFSWIRWIGDEALVEGAKAGLRGVGRVVTGAAQKTIEKRVAPAERLAQLNADILRMSEATTEHLRRRLREAKAAHHENWLTKLICIAVYDVPDTSPQEMIEHVNRAAEDDTAWAELIERLDQDFTIEKLEHLIKWLQRTGSATARVAGVTGRTLDTAAGTAMDGFMDGLKRRSRVD